MNKLLQLLPRKTRIVAEFIYDNVKSTKFKRGDHVINVKEEKFDTVVFGFGEYYMTENGLLHIDDLEEI